MQDRHRGRRPFPILRDRHGRTRGSGRAVLPGVRPRTAAFGCPDEVLTDNGKQFTGRFT
jgi:hypothetical protein